MMNSKFLNDSAEVLANRPTEAATTPDRVARAIQLATSRPATKQDIADGVALIEHYTKNGIAEAQALHRFCLLVLNLNEFVYLD